MERKAYPTGWCLFSRMFLPDKNHGFDLFKKEFGDGWALDLRFVCVAQDLMFHMHSCKRVGFVTLCHNELRNITADPERNLRGHIEQMLAEMEGELLQQRTSNRSREARLDVSAVNFWVLGQRALFDIKVFDHSAQRYRNLELEKCYTKNELEKKRQLHERVRSWSSCH